MTGTQLVLLGTGTPNAEPDRAGSAVAIVVDDTPYLVDFGAGVVRRAAAAHQQKGVVGLAVPKLSRAFLTHLHSDHTAGYADLILTPWVLERSTPLQVYGPAGIQAMTDHLLAAYQADITERNAGTEPHKPIDCTVQVAEVGLGLIYQDDLVKVEACPAVHGSWTAYSYRFTTSDRTIVISGDTAPHSHMTTTYANCDILVHEVYSWAGFQTRPPIWQHYHQGVHTSTKELAEVAHIVQPGLVVLYHQLLWGQSEASLLEEIREIYAGNVVSGQDLDLF